MDESQFLQLIGQHQGIIHKVCRLYRDSPEDREDLCQEIVFQLWRSIATFEGTSQFSSWMYKIALNTAIASFRRKKPDITYTSNLPDQPFVQYDPGDQHERLIEALKQLNDADKALMALYLDDLSYREMAEITGISENNVGVKLNRIKSKIQQLLKIK